MTTASRRRRKSQPYNPAALPPRQFSNPTPERLAKAVGAFEVGNDQQGCEVITIRDAPLDRMKARRAIGGSEYSSLQKYRHHWYHGGLEPTCGSVDLNRIFSTDPLSMSGMAKSERQAFHRQQWRTAYALLGHKTGIVVDNVVCHENSLEIAGYAIGYNSPFRARQGAEKHLLRAGDILGRHWGIR